MNSEQAERNEADLTAEPSLNYFSYFSEVEDTFIRRRQKHLHLCSLDWALIEMWKDRGVPLHVVLRGIERWFDFYEAKRKKRNVNMLIYCEEEVEAQYAEWIESRVGAATSDKENASDAPEESALPFARSAILEHLQHARARLTETGAQRSATADEISESLTRAVALLRDLEKEFAEATSPDAQKLEVSLTGIERMLSNALRLCAPPSQLEALTKEIKKQLAPYRSHMEMVVYDQTLDNLLLKRLREQFGVPRLSLFYL